MLINKSELGGHSVHNTDEKKPRAAFSTRTGLCVGQSQLSSALCGPVCCADTRSAASRPGSWGCAVKTANQVRLNTLI